MQLAGIASHRGSRSQNPPDANIIYARLLPLSRAIPRRRALAHSIAAGQTDLPVQIHGVHPPAPPRRREEPHWQSFPPPRWGYPAATVIYFLTAVSISSDRQNSRQAIP